MNYYSKKVNDLTPYIPGEQPKEGEYIKLNTNENPYPPSKNVISAIKNYDFDKLRLYPDPESIDLRRIYAKYLNLNIENIFVGNGSDEVLATAFQTFFTDKENVIMPDITYSFYPVYCNLYNIKAKEIPLKEDFTINIKDYMKKNNGIVIANPNAPTGIAISKEKIEKILKNNKDSIVLIDEAYVDFGAESCVSLINKYKNLLVVRTLSKSYSLAGMRIGFAIGDKELIDGMNRVKNSFNSYPIDRIAQIAAIEAIKDNNYFNITRNKIINTRNRVSEELKKIGFKVLDSKTNFLFVSNNKVPAQEIFNKLKENKILVRYFKKPRLNNFIRITIGTDKEMDIFLNYLKEEKISEN